MFVLVLAAEADETRQAVTLLIVCLVGIAVMLAVLTVWYWMFTSPKRRAGRLLMDLGHYAPAEIEVADSAAVLATYEVDLVGARVGRVAERTIVSEPTILSESSELFSSMMAGSEPQVLPTAPPSNPPSNPPSAQPRQREQPHQPSQPLQSERPARSSERQARPDRPDLRVAAAPKAIRPDAKPTAAPTPSRPARRSDSDIAHPVVSIRQRKERPLVGRPAKAQPKQKARSTPAAVQKTVPKESTEKREGASRIEAAARPSLQPSAAENRSAEDELVRARQRRARKERDQEGLSDDDWAAVMKSAFNHLNR